MIAMQSRLICHAIGLDAATEASVREVVMRWGFQFSRHDQVEAFANSADLTHAGCVLAREEEPTALLNMLESAGSPLTTLVVLDRADTRRCVNAMRHGAADILELPADMVLLPTAIESACALSLQRRQRLSETTAAQRRLAQLTDGEREVLQLMLHGKVNKNIASRLGIALRTVEARRKRVFTKMGTRSLAEIAAVLQTSGLLATTSLVSLN